MANSASHATLDYSARDRVAYAAFARPDLQKRLNEQALDDINDVVARVQADHHLRTLVLRGQGEAFSVGPRTELMATAFADLELTNEHVLTRVAATCLSLRGARCPGDRGGQRDRSAAGFELALALRPDS